MDKNTCYVISVRLCTGLYRHIKINGEERLDTLGDVILSSYDFDDDFTSSFYIKNKGTRYITEYICSTPLKRLDPKRFPYNKYAEDFTLNQLHLDKGQKFEYRYEFVDTFEFQCRVLRVQDDSNFHKWKVIRKVGESPTKRLDEEDLKEWYIFSKIYYP